MSRRDYSAVARDIEEVMKADNWRDVPEDGEPLYDALQKVYRYIQWLREHSL